MNGSWAWTEQRGGWGCDRWQDEHGVRLGDVVAHRWGLSREAQCFCIYRLD